MMNNRRDLPRKKKKRLYGKRGKRKQLVIALMDNPKLMGRIVNQFRIPDYTPLSYLVGKLSENNNKDYKWPI